MTPDEKPRVPAGEVPIDLHDMMGDNVAQVAYDPPIVLNGRKYGGPHGGSIDDKPKAK